MDYSLSFVRENNSLSTVAVIALGCLFGFVYTISSGFIFILFLVCLILFLIILFVSDNTERRFLLRIFIYGFILRLIFLFISYSILAWKGKFTFHLGDMAVSFFGDDGYYTVRSWWIAQYLSGNKLNSLFMSGAFHPYAWSGYLVLMALFYCFFGFSPISVTFLNCIFSVSSGVIFYLIAKEVTSDSRIARLVTILCVFFPSLFLWSIVNLKDSAYIFLTIVILWSFLKVVKNKGMMYFIFLILALGLQYSIRSNIFILCSTIVILVFNYLIIKNKQKYMILIFLIFLYILFSFKVDPYVLEMKNKLISYHKGVVSTGGFVYHLYDNWVYRPEINSSQVGYFALFKASIRGWIHYFLEPFPWKIYTWLNLMALPQMMLWYFLLPFAMMGFFMQLCCNWRYSILLISYLLVIGSILSLTGGNIGTDFRIRDLLTPIILFFSAVGLSRVFINNIRE